MLRYGNSQRMSRNKRIERQQEMKWKRPAENTIFHNLPNRKVRANFTNPENTLHYIFEMCFKVHDVRKKRSEAYFEDTEHEREQMMNRMVRTPRNTCSLVIL